jgi:probable HAF family extracellular repeat protein
MNPRALTVAMSAAFATLVGGCGQGTNDAADVQSLALTGGSVDVANAPIACGSPAGALIDIGPLPGDSQSAAVGIDKHGDVLAASGTLTAARSFFWRDGTATELVGAYGLARPVAMNSNGRAVGRVGGGCGNMSGCVAAWDAPSPTPIPFGVTFAIDDMWLAGVGDNDAPFGVARVQRGCSNCYHAVTWGPDLGTDVIDLGTIDGVSTTGSNASAINKHGDVVGTSGGRAVIWNPAIGDMGNLGAGGASGVDVNAAGQAVGTSATPGGYPHAFLWQAGVMQDLGTLQGGASAAVAINKGGDVAGSSDGHAFLWTRGTMIDLGTLGGASSTVVAVNDSGQVAGTSDTAAGTTHAFLWTGGTMIDLGTLGGPNSRATAINVSGRVVGTSGTADGTDHAFVSCPLKNNP